MTKVVINRCYGGFSLSEEAVKHILVSKGYTNIESTYEHDYPEFKAISPDGSVGFFNEFSFETFRDDVDLVNAIETLTSVGASGDCAELKVVEIPDDVSWCISEYDGMECVAEQHRTWS